MPALWSFAQILPILDGKFPGKVCHFRIARPFGARNREGADLARDPCQALLQHFHVCREGQISTAARDPRVDADHFTLGIQQRPATVARGNRSGCLNPHRVVGCFEPFAGFVRQILGCTHRAYNACRNRKVEALGMTDGDDVIPLLRRRVFGQRQIRVRRGRLLELQDGQIVRLIGDPKARKGNLLAILELRDGSHGILDDVKVGRNAARGIDQEATSQAGLIVGTIVGRNQDDARTDAINHGASGAGCGGCRRCDRGLRGTGRCWRYWSNRRRLWRINRCLDGRR